MSKKPKLYPTPQRPVNLLAYEAMDRARTVLHMVEVALLDNTVWCDKDKVYKRHVERAIGNLYRAYQRAGRSAMP
jgi:hypothetical protein